MTKILANGIYVLGIGSGRQKSVTPFLFTGKKKANAEQMLSKC